MNRYLCDEKDIEIKPPPCWDYAVAYVVLAVVGLAHVGVLIAALWRAVVCEGGSP